ncbi:MAG: hypothetical protein AUJ75_01655 [Candidatus Omnitrophica bacterium CG1_02_49_10]|nr:MAG: hypothetical protein AUJ75_01655 [Candidatus Omnitrophica bacterium CG1_02_49_10]
MKESEVKNKYELYLAKVASRKDELDNFCRMLHNETNWLTAPASTRFHLSKDGGLLEHSINVTDQLFILRDTLYKDIPDESCVIVGLFHDVGKVGLPGKPYYIANDNDWEREKRGIMYRTSPGLVRMPIAQRSLYLMAKYISLTDTEAQAILFHDGQYIDENSGIAHNEEPLTVLVHYADYWACHIIEGGFKHRKETVYKVSGA